MSVKMGPDEHDDSQRLSRNELSPHNHPGKGDHSSIDYSRRHLSPSPAPSSRHLSPIPRGSFTIGGNHNDTFANTQLTEWQRFWSRNRGSAMVALSQFFGALMNLAARLLELDGEGIHPVQLLLLRQSVTSACCFAYMWYMNVPDAPFGAKSLRLILAIRGFTGFFGIIGLWCSMLYLSMADAIVIAFLAPGFTGILCFFLCREPFPRKEQLATLVALVGVAFIAQPASLFSGSPESGEGSVKPPEDVSTGLPGADHEATAPERLLAVGMALVGVCGAAGAYTCVRYIGKRAHPLISVNFFGMASTIICVLLLIFCPLLDINQPSLRFTLPTSPKAWLLLFSLGALGFVMQYLLTAGLAADSSNRANSMIYTHMLFAASFDKWVFGRDMGLMSFFGCTLILGSAVGIMFLKRPPEKKIGGSEVDVERQRIGIGEAEASPMLMGVGGITVDDVPLERMR